MTYKLKHEGRVKGLGDVYYAHAPFDKAMDLFKENSLKLITARDLAFARIQIGKKRALSIRGSLIKEGVVYFPSQKDKTVLVRSSAALRNPVKATEAHRQGKEFFLTEKTANEYLERVKAERDSVHVYKDTGSIPADRFGEDELTIWLFKDQVKEYGAFLKDGGIRAMSTFFYSSKDILIEEKPYATQLALGGRETALDLVGWCRSLEYPIRIRGVKKIE